MSLIQLNRATDLGSKFYELQQKKLMVDVILSAEGKFIEAHKTILAAVSDWFMELFALLPGKHPVIVLKDVSFVQLQQLIEFLYLGTIRVSEEEQFHGILKSLRIDVPAAVTQPAVKVTPAEEVVIKQEPLDEEQVIEMQPSLPPPPEIKQEPEIEVTEPQQVAQAPPVQKYVTVKRIMAPPNIRIKQSPPVSVKQSPPSSIKLPMRILQGITVQRLPTGHHARLIHSPTVKIAACCFCGKAFSINKRKNAHEKLCMKNPERPSSQCPYCPMILHSPQYIATHIQKVHYENLM